jgi:hypothetical protein
MAPHIIRVEELQQSAREVFEKRGTINDCPERYCHFVEDWQEQFKIVQFDHAHGVAE